MGVRRIHEFDLPLLDMWCWMMLEETQSLRYKVSCSKYGEKGGRLRVGGGGDSVWWQTVNNIIEGVVDGGWLFDNISRKVGDETSTLFWSDPWLDGVPLKVRFGRLFELAD